MKSQKEETPEFKHCPFCGMNDTLTKKKVTRQKIKDNKIVKGVFDMWECSECKEGFFQHWTMETKDIPKTDKA